VLGLGFVDIRVRVTARVRASVRVGFCEHYVGHCGWKLWTSPAAANSDSVCLSDSDGRLAGKLTFCFQCCGCEPLRRKTVMDGRAKLFILSAWQQSSGSSRSVVN